MKCSSHIHLTWHSVLHNVFRRKKRKKKKSARAAEKSMTYWFPSTAGHSLNRILCLWNINAFEQWRPQPFVRIEVPTLCRRRIQNHIASRCWLWWAHSPLRIWAKKKKKWIHKVLVAAFHPGMWYKQLETPRWEWIVIQVTETNSNATNGELQRHPN